MQDGALGPVLTPVITPFKDDLSPDGALLERHCRWLVEQGSGLAVFGTNSEGNSLSVEEKMDLLDRLVAGGLPAGRMMPGTGSCALPDAIRLTRHAVKLGCGGVLMLPPFYYKGVADDGIYRFFAEVIEAVGDPALRLFLYHIPPVAQVGFNLDLIERLVKDFPGTVAGIKDSSGDFEHTRELLRRLPGWGTYCGNEVDLAEAMRLGAAGCISATCNVNAGHIVELAQRWDDPEAGARQAQLNQVRATVGQKPMIPALKSLAGRFHGARAYRNVRPPLMALTEEQEQELFASVDALDYSMAPARAELG